MVNLSSIMHSKQARLAIPDFFQDKDPPIISYTYTKPIGPTIFNFRKVARKHDINEPLNNECACKQSNFLYQPLGHVITGDLRIMKNKKLRNLIAKGPNYREQNNIDWDLCHKLCMDDINNYRKRWANGEKVALSVLKMNGHVMLKKQFLIGYDNYGCAHKKQGKGNNYFLAIVNVNRL